MTAARFTDEQVRRYSRQILLVDVGGRGQARLLAAEVAIDIGGAAGRIAALLLGAAGVGRIVLCGALDRVVTDEDVGFPLTAGDRGRALGDAMAAHVIARNGDVTVARATSAPAGSLQLGDDPSLASALARAGEAASAIAYRLATGATP